MENNKYVLIDLEMCKVYDEKIIKEKNIKNEIIEIVKDTTKEKAFVSGWRRRDYIFTDYYLLQSRIHGTVKNYRIAFYLQRLQAFATPEGSIDFPYTWREDHWHQTRTIIKGSIKNNCFVEVYFNKVLAIWK